MNHFPLFRGIAFTIVLFHVCAGGSVLAVEPTATSSPFASGIRSSTFDTLDPAKIDAVIKQHLDEISECFDNDAARKRGTEGGRLVAHFVIEPDGSVSSAKIADSKVNDQIVEDCLAARFRSFRFPNPTAGGVVTVNYPLLFSLPGDATPPPTPEDHLKPAEMRAPPSHLTSAARAAAVTGSSLVISLTGSGILVQGALVESTQYLARDGYWSASSLQDVLDERFRVRPSTRFTLLAEPGVKYQVVKKVLVVAERSGFVGDVDFELAKRGGGNEWVARIATAEARNGSGVSAEKVLRIEISRKAMILVDGKSASTLASTFDAAALAKGLRKAGAHRHIFIVSEDDIPYGDVMAAVNVCVDAGATSWSLSGTPF